MKNIFENKKLNIFLILLVGMVLGAFSVKIYDNYRENDNLTPFYVKMLKLQEKELENTREFAKTINSHIEEVSSEVERTDYYASVDKNIGEDEISYKLNFEGYNQNDIDVKIENDVITFKAVKEIEDQNNYLGSRFSYSFSIPSYNKDKQPEIVKNTNNIVVKFFKNSLNTLKN